MLTPATLAGVATTVRGHTATQVRPASLAPVSPLLPPTTTAPARPAPNPAPPPSTSPQTSPPRGLPRGSLLDLSV